MEIQSAQNLFSSDQVGAVLLNTLQQLGSPVKDQRETAEKTLKDGLNDPSNGQMVLDHLL